MRSRRFAIGVVFTGVWLLGAVAYVVADWHEAKSMLPNQWADVFAGFSAPLAFLWLVLGYLQQGDELRLSTEALQLQAQELRQSVEHQRDLVEVTRLQMESERERLQQERLARRAAAQPQFAVRSGGASFSSGNASYGFSFHNLGATSTRVIAEVEFKPGASVQILNQPVFIGGTEHNGQLALKGEFPHEAARLIVSYTDAHGAAGAKYYSVVRDSQISGSGLTVIAQASEEFD